MKELIGLVSAFKKSDFSLFLKVKQSNGLNGSYSWELQTLVLKEIKTSVMRINKDVKGSGYALTSKLIDLHELCELI